MTLNTAWTDHTPHNWRLPLRHPAHVSGPFREGRFSEMTRRTNCRIALRRLDMPLTPAVAAAPLVASRHVGKRISLSVIRAETPGTTNATTATSADMLKHRIQAVCIIAGCMVVGACSASSAVHPTPAIEVAPSPVVDTSAWSAVLQPLNDALGRPVALARMDTTAHPWIFDGPKNDDNWARLIARLSQVLRARPPVEKDSAFDRLEFGPLTKGNDGMATATLTWSHFSTCPNGRQSGWSNTFRIEVSSTVQANTEGRKAARLVPIVHGDGPPCSYK